MEKTRAEQQHTNPVLDTLLPPPPHRFVQRLPLGIGVEVITVMVLIVTLSSGQLPVVGYVLGLIGIMTPLLLLTWSFWLVSRDKEQQRQHMRELEHNPGKSPHPLAA